MTGSSRELAETQPRKIKAVGYLCKLLAFPIGLVIAMLAAEMLNESMDMVATTNRNNLMGGFLGIAIGMGLWSYGERHLQPDAYELLLADTRPPILYLRSFANENMASEEELAIAQALEPLGPFVAIGKPGERLPPLGASRMYLSDDSWQAKVQDVMARARMVLVAAGSTPGLGWELAQCGALDDPTRLVIMVPNDRSVYEDFVGIARESGLRLPAFPPEDRLKYATHSLAALLTFNADWKPVYVPLPQAKGRDIGFNPRGGENRGGRAWMALSHVMARLGITLEKPPVDQGYWLRRIILIIMIPALLFLFAMLFGLSTGILSDDCPELGQELCIDDARAEELLGN